MNVEKFNTYFLSENMKYHIQNNISVFEGVFRPGSESFYELLTEARNNTHLLSEDDKYIFENTDIGLFGEYEGEKVPLDLPMITESEYRGRKVKLNKPMRSTGPKKYKVYVKDPKSGSVKVVHFGDAKGGLTAKINDPGARKSFVSRHKCDRKWKPEDKMKPSYWSCRLPKFKNLVSTDFSGYW